MMAFAKKDILLLKKDIWLYLILFIVMAFIIGGEAAQISFLLSFYSISLIFLTFGYDDKAEFYGYAASLPRGKEKTVLGKYVAYLVLLLSSIILNLLVSFIASSLGKTNTLKEILDMIPILSFITSLVMGLIIPLLFKYGAQKGRLFVFLAIFGGSFGLGWILKRIDIASLNRLIDFMDNSFFLLILGLVCILTSYLVSLRIVKNKEF